jgi:hypothetical protein
MLARALLSFLMTTDTKFWHVIAAINGRRTGRHAG